MEDFDQTGLMLRLIRAINVHILVFVMVTGHRVTFACLLLYVHSKQLRSCQNGQFLNHTVPGQASQRQSTSI